MGSYSNVAYNGHVLNVGEVIGIIGGGQLGRMMCLEAMYLGYKTCVYTASKDDPAVEVASECFIGEIDDEEQLTLFANSVSVITFETELVDCTVLRSIKHKAKIFPNIDSISISQDRLQEKNFLREIGVSVVKYEPVYNIRNLKLILNDFGSSVIVKTSRNGYDGKGQFVIHYENYDDNTLDEIWKKIDSEDCLIEELVDYEKELSIVAVRDFNGKIYFYPMVENEHENGILIKSQYNKSIDFNIEKKGQEFVYKIMTELDFVGVIGVEFFLIGGELVVNEVAPRPHNSGHWTLNGCVENQFSNHIRAVVGASINPSSVEVHSKVTMYNILGDQVKEVSSLLNEENITVYLYGKKEIRDRRKMGHYNISRKI